MTRATIRAAAVTAGLLAGAGLAGGLAPVPKEARKTMVPRWTFPPLDAREWKPVEGADGLKVWDATEGAGDPVPAGATVTVHYAGWLTDKTPFDSSKDRGQPSTFALGQLIRGWQLGVAGMKPGGVRRLYVPAALGYGERGSPPKVPGNAALVFEVELVDVPK
jgi:FKBP-type peptidyl-prolyl cis-trans isomerase